MLPYVALAIGSAIGFAIVNLYLKHRPRPEAYVSSGIDLKNQTVLLPGPERIRRSPAAVDKLVSYFFEDCKTLHEAFLRGVRTSGNREFLGTRAGDGPYVWETYNQIYERVVNFGSGLINLGIAPGQQTFIGIYSQNRPEWIITEQASNAWSTVLVPLYDTLGSDSVQYIVNQARISVIVCDAPKIKGLLGLLPTLPTLKVIIKMEQVTEEEKKLAENNGVSIQSMISVEKLGKANPRPFMPPQPNDVATVCYTSGTTGDPKGAMLTHCNLISDTASLAILVERSNVPKPVMDHNDVHISYLPLAHMFERVAHLWLVQCGARIGFFRGDVKLLMQDITALRPTVFVSVPRLLNRVYDKVMAGVDAAPSYKKSLFKFAVAAKTRELEQGIIRNNSIWDKLVFHKVQSTLGGRIKFVLTGAAPISKSCLQFLRVAFGCPVLEGYGQTECTAGACLTLFDDTQSAGTVGSLLPCGEIKLVTVPDTKYNAANDEGEVCFRGFHVMKGYLNNPEKTAEAIDSDGWLHSGDIGKWDEFGRLRIIDRKKAIFKLAQGEYIAPEKIENIYIRAKSVAQVFVYGDSLQSTLVAIIVPDHEAMPSWIKDNVPGLNPNSSMDDICRDPRVISAVHKEIIAIGQESKLASFEQVKAVHLTPHQFTVENHQLTPTFKAKRPQITEAYHAEIERMYAKIASEQPPEKH